MYSSNKRKKELARKKKQEEKRSKRQKDSMEIPADPEGTVSHDNDSVPAGEKPEQTSD